MSSVGFSELFLLFIIGLLILGPERLPRVASQIGRWVGRARRTANQLRYQLEREIAQAEIEQPKPKPARPDQAASEPKPATDTATDAAAESAPEPATHSAAEGFLREAGRYLEERVGDVLTGRIGHLGDRLAPEHGRDTLDWHAGEAGVTSAYSEQRVGGLRQHGADEIGHLLRYREVRGVQVQHLRADGEIGRAHV